MKKDKLFYLDFIRAISMIIIVTYHFFAHFAENNIIGVNITNGRWGQIGVALFFVISGASLMYNYKDNISLKEYFKKRFLGIYPMFWIAYGLLFLYLFYITKSADFSQTPTYTLIFSLFGMDGYLSPYFTTTYLIGEWFLGCIVLIYLLFPLLRILVNKWGKTTIIVATIVYILTFIFYKNGKMPLDKTLIVSVYGFLLGMYIVRIKKFKWWYALIAFVIAVGGYLLPSSFELNVEVFASKLVGYSLFIVLAFIGQYLNNKTVQRIFMSISKYSYAIFLVHHYIIMKIESEFQNQVYGVKGTILLYLTCFVVIAIFAKLLYMTNKKVVGIFRNKELIEKREENKNEQN